MKGPCERSPYMVLRPRNQQQLETFLSGRLESSMFLRSNLRSGGIDYQGKPYQAEYVAMLRETEIVAVASHAWNGNLILQAPVEAGQIARRLVLHSRRSIRGLIGPWIQVKEARAALGLAGVPAGLDSCEDLFALDLKDLQVPEAMRSGRVTVRLSSEKDFEFLTRWRVGYEMEAMGSSDNPATWKRSREAIERWHRERQLWIAFDADRPVAMSAFNAALPDCVQVGGVYTPPEMRGHGYARSAVAASLMDAAQKKVARAILFTETHNAAARRAYEALGFRIIGDYGLVVFEVAQLFRWRA